LAHSDKLFFEEKYFARCLVCFSNGCPLIRGFLSGKNVSELMQRRLKMHDRIRRAFVKSLLTLFHNLNGTQKIKRQFKSFLVGGSMLQSLEHCLEINI
jgi:hypothetical protein